jgi:hypothetical protein
MHICCHMIRHALELATHPNAKFCVDALDYRALENIEALLKLTEFLDKLEHGSSQGLATIDLLHATKKNTLYANASAQHQNNRAFQILFRRVTAGSDRPQQTKLHSIVKSSYHEQSV